MTMQPYVTTTGATLPELDRLRGMNVYDLNDDKIGSVEGVYVNNDERTPGAIRYLAVESGWFGTKRHIIPLDDVQMTDKGNALVVPYGRDHLETAPTYDDRDELPPAEEERIYSHYGRTGYWHEVAAKQTTPAATPEIARAEAIDDAARRRDASGRLRDDDALTVGEHQSTPSATPEIAEADVAAGVTGERRGHDTADRDVVGEPRGVRRHDW